MNSFKEMRVSLQIISLLVLLLLAVSSGGYFVVNQLKIFENDAFMINHIGIVRGAIQRITKRELSNNNSELLIAEVDNIFDTFKSRYFYNLNSIYSKHDETINSFEKLEESWIVLKKLYLINRKSNKYTEKILNKSESCWNQANILAFSVQATSEEKLRDYKKDILFILAAVGLLILGTIIRVYKVVHNNLELAVITDSLTKLYNRSYFDKIMEEQIGVSHRYDSTFSLIIIDIDFFKKVNDEFGHQHGDKVLILLSTLLTEHIRDVDLSFRIGGEEFAIIVPQTNLQQAKQLAEKYRLLISKTDFNLGRALTISIGVAEYSDDTTSESVFRRADNALYQAKSQGRNIVVTSPAEKLN